MDGDEAAGMVSGTGQCPREGGAKCGRWNPTAQQVKVLMELFRSGLRTPSTEQIQSITSHLSSLGKIETKNVFYWFQNHKARERHHKKRRRGQAPAAADADASVLAPTKREAKNVYITAAGVDAVLREPQERKIETLELFPIKSYDLGMEKVTTARNECREIPLFDAGRDLLLDLRLSFL